MPVMHESSRLLPPRESSSAQHNWRHLGNASQEISSLRNNLSMVQNKLTGGGFNSLKAFHPFKIYQVPQAFCVITPDVPSVTPGNSWRTFSVRDGLVSYRSKWDDNGNQPIITPASPRTQGNFDNVLSILGTDGLTTFNGANTDYQIEAYATLPFSYPVQLDGYNETAAQGLPIQFVLTDVANSAGGWRGAGIYLKILDNPGGGGTTAYLAARMFDDTTGPFPDPDPMLIPLGVVIPADAYSGGIYDPTIPVPMFIIQVQYGHLINLYPPTPGDIGSFLNYRGEWAADSLSGQFFWPGDVVTVIATTTAGGLTLTSTNLYVHDTTIQVENTPPPGPRWKALSENVLT
jgi:hypothetical protein